MQKQKSKRAEPKKYRKYYDSASRAIEHLVLHLDDLETEGEQTFEDGMMSCSALQIALYALTLSAQTVIPTKIPLNRRFKGICYNYLKNSDNFPKICNNRMAIV